MILIWLGASGLIPARSSRLRPWAGASSSSKMMASACSACASSTTSRALPLPRYVAVSGVSRTWITRSTASAPAVSASMASSSRDASAASNWAWEGASPTSTARSRASPPCSGPAVGSRPGKPSALLQGPGDALDALFEACVVERQGEPDVALPLRPVAGPRRHHDPRLLQEEVGERTGALAARRRSEDVDGRLWPGKGPSRRVEPVDQGVPAAAVHPAVGPDGILR